MDLPKRKANRLTGYDYSGSGTYFLTLCSKRKQHLFSHIVGRGILDAPELQLTECGKCIDETLTYLAEHNESIDVEKYVIMPNHVHLLVSVGGGNGGASGMPRPTMNALIPKFVSSLKRFTNKQCGAELWQNGYYDHIIRDENDYLSRWRYIDENPLKWTQDEYFDE